MRRILLSCLGVVLAIVIACDDPAVGPAGTPSRDKAATESSAPTATTVVLPAGSVDALADAIAAAGPGGTVVVASGSHYESDRVRITAPLLIRGEAGARITFGLSQVTPTEPELDPDLHIQNTRSVRIEGVEFEPGNGLVPNTAVLIDHSPDVSVADNVIGGHQFGVLVIGSDRAVISGNTIDVSTQPSVAGNTFGIVVVSGAQARVTDNTVTGGVFGIWACDRQGVASDNSTSDAFVGLILCTVPQNSFLVDGIAYGADTPCTQWVVNNNTCSDNAHVGLLVIDSASKNRLELNTGSGNGDYDIEFAGDSMRFGFLTPTSSKNRAVLGNQPTLRVKDCGVDNRLSGNVNLIDNTVEPCN